jgi:hypothetical protein
MDQQTAVDVQNSICLSVSHYTVQILLLYNTIKSKHVYLHTTTITTLMLFTAQQTAQTPSLIIRQH